MQNLTPEIIAAAIVGFESQKIRIDEQIAKLRAMLLPDGSAWTFTTPYTTKHSQTSSSPTPPEAATGKPRKFSSATIQRMREAQQRRWAKVRGESQPSSTPAEAPKPKRRLSAAAKAKLVANLRKARAAKAAKANAAAKKGVPGRNTARRAFRKAA